MTRPILLVLLLALCALALGTERTCPYCHQKYDPNVRHYDNRALNNVLYTAARLENYKFTPAEKKAALRIVQRESDGFVTMRCPTSTSRGLFGLLNRTRRDVGIVHNLCPVCQTRSGIRYIKQRKQYQGSFTRALRYHLRRGDY